MKNPQSSLQRFIDVLDYLVDDRVGIIHYVQEVRREAGAPDFFQYSCRACNTQAFSREKNFHIAGGASTIRGQALAKAVGEGVERYCGALYNVEELPLSSYKDASFPCISPSEFALFSSEQYERLDFPFVPFGNTTPVRWIPALDPFIDETCYVPAAMVYVPYNYYQGDAPIVQAISTGLACHCSPEEAAIHGICEVIERDAFTITWQARLAKPQIRIASLSDSNRDLIKRFERTGNFVTLFNVTMDVDVPTILAVLRNNWPEAVARVFAAATELDPEQAIRKSLEELEHTRRYMQQVKSHLPRLASNPNYDKVIDQASHINFWCDQANTSLADFIFASEERISFDEIKNIATGEPKRDLSILLEKVRVIDHRVLLVDVTTQDVRDLGLAVVRAIIPGFHPLFMGNHIRALGGKRLWEIPQKLGYQGITRESGDNPVPHPFP